MLSFLVEELVIWSPVILWGSLFLCSYHKEPRQFKNAIFFLLLVLSLVGIVFLYSTSSTLTLLLVLLIPLTPVVTIIFLGVNGVRVVRREGISLATLLPFLLAMAIVGWLVALPLVAIFFRQSRVAISVVALVFALGMWFFFSFVALLLYSWFFRKLPRKRVFDYIIIHGAGLRGEEPTPLLKGRIDKALELWKAQGEHAILIP